MHSPPRPSVPIAGEASTLSSRSMFPLKVLVPCSSIPMQRQPQRRKFGRSRISTLRSTSPRVSVFHPLSKHASKAFDVVLPSVVWGPLVPNFPLSASPASLGTNLFIQNLLDTPDRQFPAF